MDRLALQTLKDELLADAAEAEAALAAARDRQQVPGPAGLEAAAFNVVRLYHIVEQMALRVAKTFENLHSAYRRHADFHTLPPILSPYFGKSPGIA